MAIPNTWLLNRGTTDLDVFRFQDLVFDVQAYIIALLSPSELLPLTLVSRYFSSLATIALYSDVKLIFDLKPREEGSHEDRSPLEALKSLQHAFTTQILTRKEYACHVRRLTWQVCGSVNNTFTNLFPLLDNVTHIHLVDAHPTHITQRASFLRPYYNLVIPSPPILFPRVQSIRFTGTTSLSLIMPILHSSHSLTSISLDTISPHSVALCLLEWLRIAQLSNLRTLSLRTLCRPGTVLPHGVVPGQDEELLLAWREALVTVRHTLESVTLGFRETTRLRRDASLRLAVLAQIVLPVFWEETWPRLKLLLIEGSVNGLSLAMSRLQAVVPEVVVDTEVLCVQRVWCYQTMERF